MEAIICGVRVDNNWSGMELTSWSEMGGCIGGKVGVMLEAK